MNENTQKKIKAIQTNKEIPKGIKDIVITYLRGIMKVKEICKKFKIKNLPTLYRILRENGIEPSRNSKWSKRYWGKK